MAKFAVSWWVFVEEDYYFIYQSHLLTALFVITYLKQL